MWCFLGLERSGQSDFTLRGDFRDWKKLDKGILYLGVILRPERTGQGDLKLESDFLYQGEQKNMFLHFVVIFGTEKGSKKVFYTQGRFLGLEKAGKGEFIFRVIF